MIELTSIGKLGKPYGIHGQLRINIVRDVNLENRKFIFVRILGDKVPYEVSSIDKEFVSFVEIDAPEKASTLAGREIYIESYHLDEQTNSDTQALAGYSIYDKGKQVGIIEDVLEYPQQIMAVVVQGTETFYIPIVESWIASMNPEDKKIDMDLPEGILDVNRDNVEEE